MRKTKSRETRHGKCTLNTHALDSSRKRDKLYRMDENMIEP